MAFCAMALIICLNCGLLVGMVMGVLILLRPVTNRLLTPGQRTFLWGAGWVMGFTPSWMQIYAFVPLTFPTVPDLLVSRAERGYPLFLPTMQKAGDYYLALPGGLAVPVSVSETAITVMGVLGILYIVGILVITARIDLQVRRLARSGEQLSQDQYDSLGMYPEDNVVVRLCPNLPTSFVIRSWGKHEIALQREMSPEQMRLVFLHEREHVKRHDPWLQGIMTTALAFYFWNPILWAAYYFARRDMELACDRRVLNRLNEEERRKYAHTLVDLASDKPVWGGLTTFGECDAALRVKAATKWEPEDADEEPGPKRMFGWLVVIALIVCLMLGGPMDKSLLQDLLMDLDRTGAWTQLEQKAAEEHIALGAEVPVWIRKTNGITYLFFQDASETWYEVEFFRYIKEGMYLDLRERDNPPYLGTCDVVTWGET